MRPIFSCIFSHFWPVFLNFPSTLIFVHKVSLLIFGFPSLPGFRPPPPPFSPVSCLFLRISPRLPIFRPPKSWFGELMSPLAVIADAYNKKARKRAVWSAPFNLCAPLA